MGDSSWYPSWSQKTPQIAASAMRWASCTETLPFVLGCSREKPDSSEMILSPLLHSHTHTHNSSSHFNSAAIDSPYFCTHTEDWRTCMQTCTETYILPLPPSYSLPFCSPICSASLSFFLSPRWLAVRMVNPSWISGGYHHGDRALPHMSIDPPAG